MGNNLNEKLLFEISQIDRLLDESKPLFDLCKLKTPGYTEMAACAMTLQSFYHGIENMLKMIFKHYDKPLPKGATWHMDLLNKAFVSDRNRKPIFFNVSSNELKDYLRFRHFARNTYGFQYDWDRMKDLTTGIYAVWETIKGDIHTFIKASQ